MINFIILRVTEGYMNGNKRNDFPLGINTPGIFGLEKNLFSKMSFGVYLFMDNAIYKI